MKLSKSKIKEIEKAFLSSKTRAKQTGDVIPEGFFSKWDYVSNTNVGRSTAERQLYLLVKDNKLEVRQFRVKSPTGIKIIPYYKNKQHA